MRVTPPGGIAILSACLKRAGYHNMKLFDATWYPVDQQLRDEGKAGGNRDRDRQKRGMFPDYEWKRDDIKLELEDVDMYTAFRDMVLDFEPDVIISSIVEDTFYLWKKFMEKVSDRKFISVCGGVSVSYTHLTLPTNREV